MKKRILNKSGMTYVEMIVALALLSLIVVSFTPMLLSSYESLYEAGVKTENVYKSKEEIEQGLAVRNSIKSSNIGMTFNMNATTLFEKMNVNGRKVVSSLQDSLETIFHGVRARVDIVSPDVLYDDKSSHEIVLQTTGLQYSSSNDVKVFKTVGGNLDDLLASLTPGQICIDIIKPDKSQGSEGTSADELVYRVGDRANVSDVSVNVNKERISFTISGFDFTHSPIKICVYYVNERGILKTLSDYLYVKPAHIMIAGDLVGSDYFTTAGVEHVDISTDSTSQKSQYQLMIEGRGMNVTNSGMFTSSDTPMNADTVIKAITWVDNDENPYLDSYYVMAGTNGRVYRMYNMKTKKTLKEVMGAQNDVTATTDYSYNLDTGETVHPSFWAGEMSDWYYFRTQEEGNGYGAAADNTKDCSSGTKYNYIGKTLNYAMMFSGFNSGYTYQHQANRRISYILTEVGNESFRLGGKKMALDDFDGYTAIWEPEDEYATYIGGDKIAGFYTTFNTDAETVVYLHNDSGIKDVGASNCHYDKHLAYLRLKVYTSIDPMKFSQTSTEYENAWNKGDFWFPTNTASESDLGSCTPNTEYSWLDTHGNTANITSAVYLAGAGNSGQGQVIYFGTTPGYAFLRQSADITEVDEKNWLGKWTQRGQKVYNSDNVIPSTATCYILFGSTGAGTTVYKGYSTTSDDTKAVSDRLRDTIYAGTATPTSDTSTFYKICSDTVYKYQETDLAFTLGYCSRWRMAMGDVTSNGSTEETRSYEKYYTASHSGESYQRQPGLNAGDTNNLYYNVWFPGEFYNLIETATCDNVTVAVGYTVSGSSFMKQSVVQPTDHLGNSYYGTALGSVYNDGVLAAYTESGQKVSAGLSGKGEQNVIFKNLLYYKSPTFLDGELHSRANVRFVKVGLNAESTGEGTSGTKKYYAYYADNQGNVYKSLVATATVSYNTANDEADEEVTLVDAIADDSTGMEEIKPWGYRVSQLFSEVTAIECNDDVIIITGTPNANGVFGGANGFVVGVKNDNGTWSWKIHGLGEFTNYKFNCATIIGGYMYIGGDGWIGAVHIESLKGLDDGAPYPVSSTGYNTSEKQGEFVYVPVNPNDKIYAIAGYETT